MARLRAVIPGVGILCVLAGACEGNGALFPSAGNALLPGDAGAVSSDDDDTALPPSLEPSRPDEPSQPDEPPAQNPAPPGVVPVPSLPSPDAGASEAPPDPIPDPAPPAAVVADGAATVLPLLGVAGGDPRLGVCADGVIVGVRTTANPSAEVFGQRLTFVEPICGKVLRETPRPPATLSGTLRVTRDDSLVAWSATDGFFGVPATEVPDPRLIWVLQPETVCPESTPVVVGLSGEYDPIAPDVPDTSAIRSLFIECAPLEVAPDGVAVQAAAAGHQLVSNADAFAAPGSESYRSACEGGTVTTRLQLHAGFWLDGMLLGCSSLRIE